MATRSGVVIHPSRAPSATDEAVRLFCLALRAKRTETEYIVYDNSLVQYPFTKVYQFVRPTDDEQSLGYILYDNLKRYTYKYTDRSGRCTEYRIPRRYLLSAWPKGVYGGGGLNQAHSSYVVPQSYDDVFIKVREWKRETIPINPRRLDGPHRLSKGGGECTITDTQQMLRVPLFDWWFPNRSKPANLQLHLIPAELRMLVQLVDRDYCYNDLFSFALFLMAAHTTRVSDVVYRRVVGFGGHIKNNGEQHMDGWGCNTNEFSFKQRGAVRGYWWEFERFLFDLRLQTCLALYQHKTKLRHPEKVRYQIITLDHETAIKSGATGYYQSLHNEENESKQKRYPPLPPMKSIRLTMQPWEDDCLTVRWAHRGVSFWLYQGWLLKPADENATGDAAKRLQRCDEIIDPIFEQLLEGTSKFIQRQDNYTRQMTQDRRIIPLVTAAYHAMFKRFEKEEITHKQRVSIRNLPQLTMEQVELIQPPCIKVIHKRDEVKYDQRWNYMIWNLILGIHPNDIKSVWEKSFHKTDLKGALVDLKRKAAEGESKWTVRSCSTLQATGKCPDPKCYEAYTRELQPRLIYRVHRPSNPVDFALSMLMTQQINRIESKIVVPPMLNRLKRPLSSLPPPPPPLVVVPPPPPSMLSSLLLLPPPSPSSSPSTGLLSEEERAELSVYLHNIDDPL